MDTEKTALWTWQDVGCAESVTTVTADDIAEIRNLAVYWETAENGAAGLADADFLELGNDTSHFANVVDIFLHNGALPKHKGTIINRYAHADPGDKSILLDDIPDAEIRALFQSGNDIAFEADEHDLALWAEANLRETGIDPKRPFGTGQVARDVRAIIDPDKKLPKKQFTEQLKRAESRMMLLLQFFVQNAQLEPGTYIRGANYMWNPVTGDEALGEALTRDEWSSRMHYQMRQENEEYHQTARALAHLIWTNRLKGTYSEIAEQFQLANHFDSEGASRYSGTVEERFQAALKHFPERRGETQRPWFTLSYARLLNASARFEEVKAVLEHADLFNIPASEVNLRTVNPLSVALLEGLVAKRGLDIIGEDEFQDILANVHPDWRYQPDSIWDFVWQVQREGDRYWEESETPGLMHAQALAGQIEMLRGGFVPGE